jgi:hypothetical protein
LLGSNSLDCLLGAFWTRCILYAYTHRRDGRPPPAQPRRKFAIAFFAELSGKRSLKLLSSCRIAVILGIVKLRGGAGHPGHSLLSKAEWHPAFIPPRTSTVRQLPGLIAGEFFVWAGFSEDHRQ